MAGRKRINHSILAKTVLFLSVFMLALTAEVMINRIQRIRVMDPLDREMHNIQAVSGFLHATEDAASALENYKWDYGDAAGLISEIRQDLSVMDRENGIIEKDVSRLSREQYLIASAVDTSYGYVRRETEKLFNLLLGGMSGEAMTLYYNSLAPAWEYLGTYARELLEQAIIDSRDSFGTISELNSMINTIENFTFFLCFLSAVLVVLTLVRILRAVLSLEKASGAVSRSEFDIPDIDEGGNDEISNLASSFNKMKRSLKERVELLEERRNMEGMLHRKELETLELQNLLEMEKMQELRSQINPHFLFNTLNVIKYTAQKEGAKETDRLLGALGKLFHYALSSNELMVPLSREIRIVNEYHLLCQVRFGNKIGIGWELSPEIDLTETLVPSFVLQPMVENAVKHGLGPKEEKGMILISARPDGDMLEIRISDDGVGMDAGKLDEVRGRLYDHDAAGGHIGLANVACRLRLLGEGCGLTVISQKNVGTEITLRLPFKTMEEEDVDDQDTDSR